MSGTGHVALLTNFLPPYRVCLLRELEQIFGKMTVLISTEMEPARSWHVDHANLTVRLQRNLALSSRWRQPDRFTEQSLIHVPYDTIPQLASLRPDAILAGELGARTLQAAIYRKFRTRCPLVVWITVSETTEMYRGRLRTALRRFLLRAADAIIVNGESGARYVCGLGVDPARVFRASQTTELSAFLQGPTRRGPGVRRRLLCSGQLVARKGLDRLIGCLAERFSKSQGSIAELWIVGDGPEASRLRELRCPVNLHLRFFGHVDYGRLPEIYAQAGILAFPTLADEWGMVVVEAMAAGLPVLGSVYSQAVEELVIDGRNGWTFRPDSPEQMEHALDRALTTTTEELDQMAENARGDVTHLTPARVATKMAAAIDYAFAHGS
jgi:glycosyltransferase involved in cell wall biosynthesis